MIRLINNSLEGLAAVPKNHPVTCANPAPWHITEMKIEHGCYHSDEPMSFVTYIRGDNSMWFRLEHCMVGDYEELKDWLDYKAEQERVSRAVETTILTT